MRSSMAVPSSFFFTFLLLLLCSLLSVCSVSSTVSVEEESESFIVFMSKSEKPLAFSTHHHWYSSILRTLSPLSTHSSELLYTYDRVAHGFSARLTPSQASELGNIPGVISVLRDQVHELQTTRAPQFSGLSDTDLSGLWRMTNYGADIIIGVVDSGIWPERRSFSDQGLSPRPSSWLSKCQVGPDFLANSCNNKLIGAGAFGASSPRDTSGHGTHVASIAVGSIVQNASLFGYAQGAARGTAVKAKLAVYKVCLGSGCSDSDILAAIDQAVKDGVDVINLSLGNPNFARPYHEDPIAIGAFGAVEYGVNVVAAAGNAGPNLGTARNIAPWMLTVGASTIDREFPAVVTLGDGRNYTGTSLYSGVAPSPIPVPVVYGGDANSPNCLSGQLNASKVIAKIVFCEPGGGTSVVDKGVAVLGAGGYGIIIPNPPPYGFQLEANADMIPTALVTVADGNIIREYVRSTPLPTAKIEFRGTVIGTSPSAPRVAAFSSRGPNPITLEILTPDVIAPGVNILAAWIDTKGPSQTSTDYRRTEFNVMSGTSMAAPHVSGLVAMLQKLYPHWDPGAIKSALMTTAYTVDNSGRSLIDLATGQTSLPYSHGSGHVDPTKAADPGLVYDTGISDYVDFLCTIGYSSQAVTTLFLRDSISVDCTNRNLGNPGSLNYPSFSVVFTKNLRTVTYKRTVKNVGKIKNPVYNVAVNIPSNVRVTVSPTRLVFSETNNILSYEVTFTSVTPSNAETFGSLVWSDGTHIVSSPIAVIWPEGVAALHSDL